MNRGITSFVAGLFLFLPLAPATGADDLPKLSALQKATKECQGPLATARSAKRSCPVAKVAVKEGLALLRPHAKAMRSAFVNMEDAMTSDHKHYAWFFNEFLTLAAYHKVTVREDYIAYARRLGLGRLDTLIPVGRYWNWSHPEDADQHTVTITQKRASGGLLCQIEIHRYKWSTIYSGVGGENAKKLADVLCDLDDAIARDDGDKCSKLKVKKFNRHYKRAHFYKVDYKDPAPGKPLVREEYYVKGRSTTFNFQITVYRPKLKKPDPFTLWRTKTKPEARWLLDSIKASDWGTR